jgi:hypothetical protein
MRGLACSFIALVALLGVIAGGDSHALDATTSFVPRHILLTGGNAVLLSDGSIWYLDNGWHDTGTEYFGPPNDVAFLLSKDKLIDCFGQGWEFRNGWWMNEGVPNTIPHPPLSAGAEN